MLRGALFCVVVPALVMWAGARVEAQTSDFSGAWTLDRDASEFPQGRGGGGGRGGGRGGFGGGGPATVTITQADGELVMDQQIGDQSQTVTYRLDGGESENPGRRGAATTTMSSWDGAALVTQGSQTMSTRRGEFVLEMHERRTLSRDGQTMTVASTWTTPRGEIATTLVYRRSGG